MKYFLILNPGSKAGTSSKRFKKIFNLLAGKGLQYDYRITSNLEDVYLFSQQANKSGYDVIVAVGGDGTINRVINGFYDNDGNCISNAKFGVIYTGTSPDFCKSYHIPLRLEDAVNVIAEDTTREIQIGKIIFTKTFTAELDGKSLPSDSQTTTRYFACCANFGIGPFLANKANSGIRGIFGDIPGTFLSLVNLLFCYRPGNWTISIDGKIDNIPNVFNISIGKTCYIASGIKVQNNLICGDSRFYSLIIKDMRIKDWGRVLQKIYSGKQIISDNIFWLTYTKTVEIYGNNAHPLIEFDGDTMGFLPCKIEMAKDPLEIITGEDNE